MLDRGAYWAGARSSGGGGLGASPILLLMFKLHALMVQAEAPPLIGFGGPAGLLLNSDSTELRHQGSWTHPFTLVWSRGHWEAV
jgi:hypothetical protein